MLLTLEKRQAACIPRHGEPETQLKTLFRAVHGENLPYPSTGPAVEPEQLFHKLIDVDR